MGGAGGGEALVVLDGEIGDDDAVYPGGVGAGDESGDADAVEDGCVCHTVDRQGGCSGNFLCQPQPVGDGNASGAVTAWGVGCTQGVVAGVFDDRAVGDGVGVGELELYCPDAAGGKCLGNGHGFGDARVPGNQVGKDLATHTTAPPQPV